MKIEKFRVLPDPHKIYRCAMQLEDGRAFLLEVRPDEPKTQVYDAEGREVTDVDYKLLTTLWQRVQREYERKKRVQLLKDAFVPWQSGLKCPPNPAPTKLPSDPTPR